MSDEEEEEEKIHFFLMFTHRETANILCRLIKAHNARSLKIKDEIGLIPANSTSQIGTRREKTIYLN